MSRNDCRIYVGNLPPDIRTKDIQDLFYKFGKVLFVDLKNRRGPPFAFVEFEDPRYCLRVIFSTRELRPTLNNSKFFYRRRSFYSRDADDAVHARDGYDYDGYKLRVEFPRGQGPSNYRSGGRGSGGSRGSNRGPPTRRTNHRVVVTGTKYAIFTKIVI